MMRIPYQQVCDVLHRSLLNLGFSQERARLCAQLFAQTSRDGVYSHGLERFPRFVRSIRKGLVNVQAEPSLISTHGALERWNGNRGPGNLNAYHSMARAISLSQRNGVGCVALANTNHWMRGGTYGWQAAEAGVIGICWTNTMPNLPPWGAPDPRVGNNPVVIAVPRAEGHIVLDMAMSQFSYGALASYRAQGELLPVAGGFDVDGNLTRDPAQIEASSRPLPIGYWKGSGLALMLDLLAGLLSRGQFTWQIPADPEAETKLSQVFIALDLSQVSQPEAAAEMVGEVVRHFRFSTRSEEQIRYPGERVLEARRENMAKGIPVPPSIWKEIQEL
ncbi:MAG TPA: 3-dehydro-L-gulonate 2-dehydrogenase [Candidatus Angelobacter sp.]|nr:3-dehydro-L-gulonate 2-dehydrogenase [Candidatus Angelobacter sp.]